jgi:hypothetical protein
MTGDEWGSSSRSPHAPPTPSRRSSGRPASGPIHHTACYGETGQDGPRKGKRCDGAAEETEDHKGDDILPFTEPGIQYQGVIVPQALATPRWTDSGSGSVHIHLVSRIGGERNRGGQGWRNGLKEEATAERHDAAIRPIRRKVLPSRNPYPGLVQRRDGPILGVTFGLSM